MSSFRKADILLPENIDMTKWSVVACDQFTSEKEYWEDAKKIVGDAPSTLNLIFPEVYLSEGDERIEKINRAMKKYVDEGLFGEHKNSLVYLEREIDNCKVRRGLIGAIDLEDYSFSKGATPNVRATEGTVIERIPPRVKIRENAPLEFPHIMVLIDDEKRDIIESLSEKKDELTPLYDFTLMKEGGKVRGYKLSSSLADEVLAKLDFLSERDAFIKRYGIDAPILTFAVGDGNHSLATAKTCWENLKKDLNKEEIKNHPARFCLVELVNLHDDALEFEPIHRVCFGVNPENMIEELKKFYPETNDFDNGGKEIEYIIGDDKKKLWIKSDASNLSVGILQNFIDEYLKNYGGEVDYIHGEAVVLELSKNDNNIGFLLPSMDKNELFKTVILDGALPRKTFSMGEAYEKRYYIEGKKIK